MYKRQLLTDRALRSEIRNIDEAEQLLLSQTQPQAISNITINLTSANIHAAAEAHSYNGLLSVLEGLPLTNDSRWKILFVLQHYEQYVDVYKRQPQKPTLEVSSPFCMLV